MPGIGHLVYGLAVVAGLLFITRNKFNHKVAFIFFVNNYLGPDTAHIYGEIFHTLLGFPIFAIPLSLFYSYLSRFSVHRSGKFIDIIDDGKREVNWKNAFYATVAGGISHRMIDGLFHPGYWFGFLPDGWDLSLDNLNSWNGGNSWTAAIVLDMVMIVFIIAGSLYAIREGYKKALMFLSIVVGMFLIEVAATDFSVTGGENDVAVFFFTGVFILAPLLLIGHADREVKAHPVEVLEKPRISRKIVVPLLNSLMLAVVALFFAAGFAGTFYTSWLEHLIHISFGGPAGTQAVGIMFMGLTGVGIVGCIGVYFKNSRCRSIVMVMSTLTWYFVFPFGLALVLSENDVKSWFQKPSARQAAEALSSE